MRKRLTKIIIFLILLIGIAMIFDVPTKVMKILYPIKYENFVDEYSKKYEIDKNLIYSIIKAESNFTENAESSKGAKGLMQLMPNTAKDILKKMDNMNISEIEIETKLLEPQFNIEIGTKYISILIDKYKNKELALVAYNAGSGNVDNWIQKGILKEDGSDIENVPYKETNNYVRKILKDYKIYKELYEQEG